MKFLNLNHFMNAVPAFFLRRLGYLLMRRGLYGDGGAAWYFKEAHAHSPDNISGLLELATTHWRTGDIAAMKGLLQQAVECNPDHARVQNLLGVVARAELRSEDAEAGFRRAMALAPDWAPPHNNLGSVFMDRDDLVSAEACFRRALQCDPGYVESLSNLALLLNRTGKHREAEILCREALRVKSDFAGAFNNLGSILVAQGRIADGVAQYQEALRLQPDMMEPQLNLAVLLEEPGRLVGIMDHFRRLLERNPDSYIGLLRLAQGYLAQGDIDLAEDYARRANALNPEMADPYVLLSNLLSRQGDVHGMLECCRRALERGGNLGVRASYLFHLLYDSSLSQQEFLAEVCEWNRICYLDPCFRVFEVASFSNLFELNARLRIGYLSRDFFKHSVASYSEPIIVNHDREHFEVYCYANLYHPDAVTERFRAAADHWREIALMTDDDLARLVSEDRIDILVDLSGHTGGARTSALARRLAPVQITYLGFPATTGLDAMDYRIVDAITDPPGISDACCTERLLRLPDSFLTFQPDADAPAVMPPPCLGNGCITFGSFNIGLKVNDGVIVAWVRILQAVPGSRLLLKSLTFISERGRQRCLDRFLAHGIEASRLDLVKWIDTPRHHLEAYSRMDIALDPFPYNGTTTTCEALWMGVPVVTLLGDRHSGRVGASLLMQMGMPELVCDTVETYVQTAVDLAADPRRLASIRESLRERMQSSPLLDHAGFVRKLEAAYRQAWTETVARTQQAVAA